MRVPGTLRQKLIAAAGSGAIGIAALLATTFEGYESRPYSDPTGTLTVCYGHTGADIDPRKTYSREECQTLLDQDLAVADRAVQRYVTVPMNAYQRGALDDFVFNVGQGNFKQSTLLKRLNSEDYSGACDALRDWVYSNGVKLKGLVTRRELEAAVCSFGVEQ
ncbi:Lysozyme RrrD [Carnimonas sp. R-84981]|uniref:lysozyme n=1 Tax=Carnimonas bestiolae TaxID=3402172 RepID=UPI003EDBF85B